ncbi:MAG: hypothetical protein KDC35_10780 [Acidobacteria bacterium]|nr:hypothetical protein [Acidobacteriota bacterium]
MKVWLQIRNWIVQRISLGLLITIGSYVLIDTISGGIFGGVEHVTSLQTTAFVRMTDTKQRHLCRVAVHLRDTHHIRMEVDLFDDVLDREKRLALIDRVASVTLRFNFKPTSVVVPGSKVELVSRLEPCHEGDFCLNLDANEFRETYGHLEIHSGLGLSTRSLSSRAVKIGLRAGDPNTDVEVFVHLPDEWDVKRATPPASHVTSFATTRMIWEGDDRYGKSVPTDEGDRAIAENLGIELMLENARLENLETTLMFFLSALFGVGFTMVCEPIITRIQSKKD